MIGTNPSAHSLREETAGARFLSDVRGHFHQSGPEFDRNVRKVPNSRRAAAIRVRPSQWVRFVARDASPMAHFRVFERATRFCIGFDWVRFAETIGRGRVASRRPIA
jgi:hypothetical protein